MTFHMQSFFSLVRRLRAHGRLYVNPFSYHGLVAFLMGYDCATAEINGHSSLEYFRIWLHKKQGEHCSIHWSAIVRDQYANGDDKLAITAMFQLLEDFELENIRQIEDQ